MIGVLAFDVRRACRRRLTTLIVLIPVVLVAYALVLRWRGQMMSPLTPLLVILTSSLVMFGKAVLSDREGRFDHTLAVAALPRWFPTTRRILLLAVPFALQLALYRLLTSFL